MSKLQKEKKEGNVCVECVCVCVCVKCASSVHTSTLLIGVVGIIRQHIARKDNVPALPLVVVDHGSSARTIHHTPHTTPHTMVYIYIHPSPNSDSVRRGEMWVY